MSFFRQAWRKNDIQGIEHRWQAKVLITMASLEPLLVWYNPRMIETSLSPTLAATVLHRVTGIVDQQQATQGAAEALRFVHHLSSEHGPLNLMLDLRGKDFQGLQAHRAWSQGFARNPALHGHVQYVAIIGDDTASFRAEQELMETDRVRFFVDVAIAQEWLAQGAC